MTTYKKVQSDLCISLLRFLLAFSVLIWHVQYFNLLTSNYNLMLGDSTIFNLSPVIYLLNRGFIAVQFFWLISGYVLCKFYNYSNFSLGHFLLNRFARIYPLHFFTLILCLFLTSLIKVIFNGNLICRENNLYHFILNLFMILSIGLENGCSFNAPIWSVSIELFSYLLFGVFFYFQKSYRYVTTILIIFSSSVLYFYSLNFSGFPFRIFSCLFYFFTGVLLFLASRNRYFLLFIIISSQIIFLIIVYNSHFLFTKIDNSDLKFIIVFVDIFGFILLLDAFNLKIIWRFEKLIILLGDMSFGVYLYQYPIFYGLLAIKYSNVPPQFFTNIDVIFIFYSLLLITISFFSLKHLELPLRNRIKLLISQSK